MNLREVKLGGLSCQIVDQLPAETGPRVVVVLCHGFGAPGTDLVPIGRELLQLRPALAGGVRFVFPAAPLTLEGFGMPEGRAWWPLDMLRLQTAVETGQFRDLRDRLPEGLPAARERLTALIGELQSATGLPLSRFVLGGFSQGAMLSTDVSLHLPEPPAALCIMSGTLLCEQVWRELAARRGPLKVIQSHGTQDPLLPFEAAVWLRDLLLESGSEVDFIRFDGPHTIPLETLERLAALVEGLLREPDKPAGSGS